MSARKTRSPRAVLAVVLLSLGAGACKGGDAASPGFTEVSLTRSSEGRVAVELLGARSPVRAVQLELRLDGVPGLALTDPAPPPGIPLDTVRLQMRGANRAILFAADARGILLPRSGVLATFAAHGSPTAPGRSADLGKDDGVSVSIARAVLVDATGHEIAATIGPALSLR